MALTGIEDIYKALRQLCNKGDENHCVCIQRLYDMAAKASQHAYPDVLQQHVTEDDVVNTTGQGCWGRVRDTVRRLGRDQTSLGMQNFSVRGDGRGCHIARPASGRKTMAAAAHSSQVAMEECLLRLPLTRDGNVEDWAAVAKSWASGLVRSVGATAVGLQEPTVIADMVHGRAFLVIFNAGHVLLGWPLDIAEREGALSLRLHLRWADLAVLIVTDPYPSLIARAIAETVARVFTSAVVPHPASTCFCHNHHS